jgi:uncharacterized membrane protein YdjX (TVP38/TMEM64 family)
MAAASHLFQDGGPALVAGGNMADRHRRLWGRVGLALLLVAILAAGSAAVALVDPTVFELSPKALVDFLRGWGAWSAAASIGLMVLHSFVPFPSEILALANGMVFGAVWGAVVTWTGAMLGAWFAFGLARLLGRSFVLMVLAERHRRALDTWTAAAGWQALLVARLIPVIAFNLVNYAAGLTRLGWWTYTWATAVGMLPLTVLTAIMGERMLDWGPWAWVAAAAGIGLLIAVSYRWRPRKVAD